MASNPDFDLDKLLRKAIRSKHLIRLVYQNKERVVEPHDYGIQTGVVKLLAYQFAAPAPAKSRDGAGWSWVESPTLI